MVRHIVMWNFKPELTKDEKRYYAERIKSELENLKNLIGGIIEMKVYTDISGNREIVLDSLFDSEGSLRDYINHPEHIRAGLLVRSVTADRAGADFAV